MRSHFRFEGIIEELGNFSCMDLNSVMGKFCGDILTEIGNKTSEWTPVSTDKLLFDVILSQGGFLDFQKPFTTLVISATW